MDHGQLNGRGLYRRYSGRLPVADSVRSPPPMIRLATVAQGWRNRGTSNGRLGDAGDDSTSSITYYASTGQNTDPVSGLFTADAPIGDPSNPGPAAAVQAQASGPAAAAAVQAQASGQTAAAIAQAAQPATGFCGALGINCPTNIPSPITPAIANWLLILAAAAAALFLYSERDR
jgi:hypothetical protein